MAMVDVVSLPVAKSVGLISKGRHAVSMIR